MGIRPELVAGAILLLACALALKVVWDLRPLARLALTLTLVWAVFAAFHGWPLAYGWATNIATLAWEGFPVDAGAFWGAFVVASLPGLLLYRWTVRDAQIPFPRFFDTITGLLCTGLALWLVPSLVVMTLSLATPNEARFFPEEGPVGEWAAALRGSPLRAYLAVARTVAGEDPSELLATRIPQSLRQMVFPRRGTRPAAGPPRPPVAPRQRVPR